MSWRSFGTEWCDNTSSTNTNNISTKGYKFKPHQNKDDKKGKTFYFQHICVGCSMFEGKSPEELRFEDQFAETASNANEPKTNFNNDTNANIIDNTSNNNQWNFGNTNNNNSQSAWDQNNSGSLNTNKSQQIVSRIIWSHIFSIPIVCGKSICEQNPDLSSWRNTNYTKLKPNNDRKITCGGLLWHIYIHPNQGENSDEFALSVFPVYNPNINHDKLPDNYQLNYTVYVSLNINDEKYDTKSKYNTKWSHIIDNNNIIDVSQIRYDEQLSLFTNKQKLPFSMNDLHNVNEFNDYFNLYICIKTNFIKKPNQRGLYYGVLGSILIENELL
eukprot:8040_1